MAIAVENTWTHIETAVNTEININLDNGGAADGNTLLAFLTKDDDVATVGPAGWTLVQGFESNNAIYTEIWKREALADNSPATTGNTFSLASQDSNPRGLSWNNDGTKFYVIGDATNYIYEYTASVGFDLGSTIAYSGNSFYIGSQEASPEGLCFNADGTKFFVVGGSTDTVYEYTVSIGFDLGSTVAYSGNSFSVATEDTAPTGLTFNPLGTKFYITGNANNDIYEYTVSVGFDLSSTVAYSGNSIAAETGVPHDLEFNDDGLKLFESVFNTGIFEFTLSVAYDLGSTVVKTFGDLRLAATQDVSFNNTGTRIFTLDTSVHEYDCQAYKITQVYTWNTDSEEAVINVIELSGADYTTISAATLNVGTDAAPISNALTVAVADSVVFAGFGVDGDSTPLVLDAGLTSLSNLQSSFGAGSAGQAVGWELFPSTGSTGTFTHSMASADQWTGFAVMIEPASVSTSIPIFSYHYQHNIGSGR